MPDDYPLHLYFNVQLTELQNNVYLYILRLLSNNMGNMHSFLACQIARISMY